MKEHVEAGFARIFADDVCGRQVEEGRAQLCADGIHLEQNMMLRKLIRRYVVARVGQTGRSPRVFSRI